MDTPSTTFDITTIEVAETSFMHLKHPSTEEPMFVGAGDAKTPVGITFHNPGSQTYEAAASKQTNRSLVRSKRKTELTADLLRADRVVFLANVTYSFDHLGYAPAGETTGEELFKALYADRRYGWVVDQANAHLADWGNALKGSATS